MGKETRKLSLLGSVSMGTGVMIGAGILALTGQIAELAGEYFPLAFIGGALVSATSAYTYIKLSHVHPSSGGVAMFLKQAYGKSLPTAVFSLLMLLSMIINQSLVARTFGSYTLQLIDLEGLGTWGAPILGVLLLGIAFLLNIIGNKYIERLSIIMAFFKTIGLLLLALGGLWAFGFDISSLDVLSDKQSSVNSSGHSVNFVAAIALSILAFKGFTTITNSGDEIQKPKINIGRSIIISLALCLGVYLLTTLAVMGNLSVAEIIEAKDYALAEAAKPAFGESGLTITVIFAIVATVSGVIASIFAVSRMLTMLTKMELVPHRHFGMPGSIKKHSVVYIVVLAMILTISFDLSRIASIGAIFYLIMDIAIHFGAITKLSEKVKLRISIPTTAIILDAIVLSAFIYIKVLQDPLIIWITIGGLVVVIASEKLFLSKARKK